MKSELLAQSPLLILPIVALFLFLAVWVVAVVRAMTREKQVMEACARMPLAEEERHVG